MRRAALTNWRGLVVRGKDHGQRRPPRDSTTAAPAQTHLVMVSDLHPARGHAREALAEGGEDECGLRAILSF